MIYTMNKVSLLTTSDDVNYCIQVHCNRITKCEKVDHNVVD